MTWFNFVFYVNRTGFERDLPRYRTATNIETTPRADPWKGKFVND